MTTKKDYYEILGINKNSTPEEIKKAYRKMAREHHPDVAAASDKEEATRRFKEINEAYQVLSDSEKKRMYDQFGHAGGQGPFGGSSSQGSSWGPFTYTYSSSGGNMDFDPMDIFEEVFGFRGFGGQRRPQKGKNLFYELHIDFVDAVKGVEKKVKVESGEVTIKIPQGARNGTELRYAEKGMPGPEGMPAGDLYISLRVSTPREFQRVGDNLGLALEIDFIQAILGDEVEVPIVDEKAQDGVGSAKIKIPQGTQPGTQIRVRGKGVPKLHGSGRGDIIVQVFVKIPQRLNKKQRELLEKYRDQ